MEQTTTTKVCAKCGIELPVDKFYKHLRTKDGLQPYCKTCHNAVTTENAKKRREKQVVPSPTSEGKYPELKGFAPRILIEELRSRGYKGTLTYEYKITL